MLKSPLGYVVHELHPVSYLSYTFENWLVLLDECFGKRKSHYILLPNMFFTMYDFIGQMHVFAGRAKIVKSLFLQDKRNIKIFLSPVLSECLLLVNKISIEI